MLLIAQSIERLVVAQEVTSLSLVEEPRIFKIRHQLPYDKG